MHELALFAGGGGGILGAKILGWSTLCAVENDPDARGVLLARQQDGMLSRFPIWDDVRTFDGSGWRGQIDVVTAGFPCQDVSLAGTHQGLEGERSGLWSHASRIIADISPDFVFLENAAALVSRGLNIVLSDLSVMGFDAQWGVFRACAIGAPHMRKRLFLLAYADGDDGKKRLGSWLALQGPLQIECSATLRQDWLGSVARNARSGAGMARRVDRTRIIGNGQVPRMAASAFQTLARAISGELS